MLHNKTLHVVIIRNIEQFGLFNTRLSSTLTDSDYGTVIVEVIAPYCEYVYANYKLNVNRSQPVLS